MPASVQQPRPLIVPNQSSTDTATSGGTVTLPLAADAGDVVVLASSIPGSWLLGSVWLACGEGVHRVIVREAMTQVDFEPVSAPNSKGRITAHVEVPL
jgi:hypothetical protein